MDQGIIRTFKAYYRAAFIRRAIHRYDEGITSSQIYDINILKAMRMADAAWAKIDAVTIANCWKKAGILPKSSHPSPPQHSLSTNSAPPTTAAKDQVKDALNRLQQTGTLQAGNRMSIENLLNPEGESDPMDDTSMKDILYAVVHACEAGELMEINGGDDSDPVDPPPSRREVLQAATTIAKYVAGVGDPYACQLEALLSSLKWELRLDKTKTMKDTQITDFFKK